ncbi:MAG: helix-turn-helix domain-containing protein, partial [Deltaproteobacteria bacterium]|nr:helix-turn-helix domain-containing protein [Deltaproteobacteria bacterium]
PNKELSTGVRTYLEGLSLMVANYEREAFPNVGKKVSGREMLKYLMELQGLTQTNLQKELGGQPNVSAILKGKRKLNARQIQALAKRFNVSPSVFFDT